MGRFINIDGIDIEVVRKKGKRTMSLKINRKTGLPELSIPFLCPLFVAKNFVQSHAIWLKKSVETTSPKQYFEDKMKLDILGQNVTICHTDTHCATHIENGKLLVSGNMDHLHRRVKDFIKKQVYDYICKKAQEVAKITDKSISKITIRDTSSRWGSCSSARGLSFCWRLALAPTFVLDYVIIHEVAHLTHMDHSAAFWAHVKVLGGQTQKAKKWLNENADYLHSFV